jgi:hypothetical protein
LQCGFDRLLGDIDDGALRFFSSTLKAPKPFINSVIRPDLPKNWALAFSRSAGVWLCANKAWALATKESNSFIDMGG